MVDERKLFIKILQLNCFITDEFGFDELYLVIKKEKIWPVGNSYKSVKQGAIDINVNVYNLSPNTQLNLELWDYDFISSNDLLGNMPLYIDEPGGPYTTDMIPNKEETDRAKYSIVWEIDFMNEKD
jgi:hypothetical protein